MCVFFASFIFSWQVAVEAPAGGRRTLLGVLFDEVSRQHWADMCAKSSSFKVADQIDDEAAKAKLLK